MSPTIKDVAKRANVSIATVSRILNNLPGYSEETRKKVEQVIDELGYQPNAVARGLVSKRTQTIGVLIPNVNSMFSSEVFNGIEYVAHQRDHSVFICNTDASGIRTMKYLQLLRENQVDGIIYASEFITQEYDRALKSMKTPVVLISTYSYRNAFPFVRVEDQQAAYTATEYLIHKGHRKIAMISGTKDDPIAGKPRIEGFRQALLDNHLMCNERWISYGDFGFQSGVRAMEALLPNLGEFSAVFVASDEMAVGALSACYKQGIRVPEQLSIIGYDNTPLAQMSIPPLTSLSQPLFDMGKTAAEMLFQMIETGETLESRVLRHTIAERETVKSLI